MSKGPINHFPNPYESRDDLSHATIFFVAIFLLVGVAAVLYYGSAGALPNPPLTPRATPGARATPEGGLRALFSTPVTSAQPVPLATPTLPPSPAAAVGQPAPTGGAAPATPGPKSPTPAATTPTPGTITPSPTPTEARNLAVITNTGGDGVFLRATPRLDDKVVAWPDNTLMQLLGERADNEGLTWEKVRDPHGNIGWVPVRYLRPR